MTEELETTEDRDALFARLRVAPVTDAAEDAAEANDAAGAPDFANEDEALSEPVDVPFAPPAAVYDEVPLITVPLAFPFTVDGLSVRSISLRPPRLDYFNAMAAGRIAHSEMVAEMAGVSTSVLDALRWPDAERILAIASDLTPDLTRT